VCDRERLGRVFFDEFFETFLHRSGVVAAALGLDRGRFLSAEDAHALGAFLEAESLRGAGHLPEPLRSVLDRRALARPAERRGHGSHLGRPARGRRRDARRKAGRNGHGAGRRGRA